MRRIPASPSRSKRFRRALLLLGLSTIGPWAVFGADVSTPDVAALRQRADAGDIEAMMALGDAFSTGEGVALDYPAALRYFSMAEARGHAPAYFKTGQLAEAGKGMPADPAVAFRAYLLSAQLGWSPAQLKVGEMFARGAGTIRDERSAVDWYRKAAENGNADAQYALAVVYEQGRGVFKDRAQAQKWYREAANRGHVRARFNLALMLEGGSFADTVAAADLYRQAAEQGFTPAQNNYGLLLAEGRGGVVSDLVEAYAWLTIAVENGANAAGKNLVARKLEAAQVEAAEQRAAALRAQIASGVVSRAPLSPVETVKPNPPVAATPVARVAPAPEPSAETRPGTPGAVVAPAAEDPGEVTRLQKQLTQANEQIVGLKAERERLSRSSSQVLVDLGDLMADAADAVKTRARLVAAEQKERSAKASAEIRADDKVVVDATRETQEWRTQAGAALARWSERLSRLNADLGALQEAQAVAVRAQNADTVAGSTPRKTPPETTAESPLRTEVTKLQDELARQAQQLKQSQAEAAQLVDEKTKLVAEIAAAKSQITESARPEKISAENAQQLQQLDTKWREATAKLAAAEQELSAAKKSVEAAEEMKQHLASSQAEIAGLGQKLRETSERSRQLEEEGERLKKENASLVAAKEAAGKSAVSKRAAAQAAEWASEREKLQAKIRDTSTKLTAAEEALAYAQKKRDDTAEESARNDATKANAELVARAQRLSDENDQLKKEIEKRSADTAALLSEKQAAEAAAKDAVKNAAPPIELVQERDDLKAKVTALTAKQSEAESQLGAARQASESAQKEALAARAELEALKSERTDVQKQSARVSELEGSLQKATADKEALQVQLAGLDALKTENARMSGMAKDLTAAQQRIAELEATASQLTSVQRDFTVLTADSARLKSTLQSVEQDRRTQVARLQQENQALTTRLRQVQSTLDQIAAAARIVNSGVSNSPVAAPTSTNVQPLGSPANPPAAAPTPTGRIYTVVEGDSLTKISIRYYGTGNRWQEIYVANRDVLRGQNALRVGQQIIVP